MQINGSSDWWRVFPWRVARGIWTGWLWRAGLFAASCLITLVATMSLAADGPGSALRLLLVVLVSGMLGAFLWARRPGAFGRAGASDRDVHPAVASALHRISRALDEGADQQNLLELVGKGAREITRGGVCLLALPTGIRVLVDRSTTRWMDPTSPGAPPARLTLPRGTGPSLRTQLAALGENLGTLEVWPRPGQRFGPSEQESLDAFAAEAAVAVKNVVLLSNARLQASTLQSKISEMEWWQNQLDSYATDLARTHEELHQARSTLEETYMATLEALANAVDARDPYTYGHCRRVAELASAVAAEMGELDLDRRTLERAALLHDVGKIGVPDTTLRKSTPLTEEDWAAIRHHPELGFRMLSALRFLGDALPAIRYHHERFDGGGYPYGLSGDKIPLMARILAVADAYDAITSDRPYRPGRSKAQGLAEIARCAGTYFDPTVANALLKALQPPDQPAPMRVQAAPLAA